MSGGGRGGTTAELGGGQGEGESERGAKRVLSLPWLELGRGEKMGRRGWATAATAALGGGAARPERRGTGAAWLVVVGVELGGLFIAEERRWGGLSASGGRRGSSQPLMAFGAALPARRDRTCRAVACSGEAARAARRPQDDGMGRAGVVGVARSWWRLLRSPAGGAASSAARGRGRR